MDYLKNAIEDIPREETIEIERSGFTIMGNKETHELISRDLSHEPPLSSHMLSCINGRDAFSFNFFSFGLDNPDKEGFLMMYKTLKFE